MINRRDVVAGATAAAAVAAGGTRGQAATPDGNAVHFTMFNFKDEVDAVERARILKIVRDLGKLPTVQHLVIGPVVQTKREGATKFGWISIVGFANNADHDVYMVCEPRMNMGRNFMPSQNAWIAADLHHPGLDSLWKTKGTKLRHCVLFNFKDEVPATERDRVVAALEGLRKLPMVKAFTISRNTQPKTENSPMEWVIIADFASEDDFKKFQTDPMHKAVIEQDFAPKMASLFYGDLSITPEIAGK